MNDDPRLTISTPMRPVADDHDSTVPLSVFLSESIQEWRTLLTDQSNQAQTASKNENNAWVTLAGVWFNLDKIYRQYEAQLADLPQITRNLQISLRSMERVLHEASVELVLAEGEVYSDELADLLENVGQIYQDNVSEPVIHEVITPAVRRQGEVLQMGRVVLALSNDNH